jgi:hypothetical protein
VLLQAMFGVARLFSLEYPVPLIFAFLTLQAQLAQPVIPLLIFSPLMSCGSAAGRLHAGERRRLSNLRQV